MDYFNCFQDFILEHYSEDGAEYENEIADLMDLRQVSWLCFKKALFDLQSWERGELIPILFSF